MEKHSVNRQAIEFIKTGCITLVAVAVLALSSTGTADIINVEVMDDGDGAIICTNYNWNVTDVSLTIYGHHLYNPAHIIGTITTDTAEDPTLTIRNEIDNNSTFEWIAYQVNVFLNTNFTLSAATVYSPGDWTNISTTQPTWNGSMWEGKIMYFSGTPVAIGSMFDFGYKMTFDGLTSFSFTQEMMAIPEPGSMLLVVLSGLLLIPVITRRRRLHR